MNMSMQSLGPMTLGLVASLLEDGGGAHAVLSRLGMGALVGQPPEMGGFGWSFRTKPGEDVPPSAVSLMGMDEDMFAWPVRRRMDRRIMASELTIGRTSTNDLVIAHASVSKLHARLVLEDAGPRLVDAGSSNGTQVNDRPLPPGGARLVDGDVVNLGPVRLRYYEADRLVARLQGRA